MSGAVIPFARSVRNAPLSFQRASADSGAQRSVAGARLDNMAKQVSTQSDKAKRRDRFRLRSILWQESTLRRVQMCGRRRIKDSAVGIYTSDGRAHFTNVQTCGSVHACPVCAPKIRQRRAGEVDKALRAHLDAGMSALFQTFTLPHDFGDDLAPMLQTVAGAFRKVIAGRGYVEDKADYSITGSIRASETTFGKAGAHPHLHVIFFCDRQLTGAEIRTLNARLFARWSTAVERAGYRAPLIGLCPIERVTSSAVGMYVQKIVETESGHRRVGMEMTRHDLKAARRTGRTPFQILRDFAESGDCADLDLWREWERASKGTQSLTWSKGLKLRYRVAEKTDEELAAEQVGGELVIELTPAQWNLIQAEQCSVTVLEIAEESGAEALQFWLFVTDHQRQRQRENCTRLRAA